MLALLCAAIVAGYERSWLSAPLAELARRENIAPPRVTELKGRLLKPFEQLLAQSRRRGRRRRPVDPQAEARMPEALLAVAAEVIREIPIRRRAVQLRLLAAAERLHRESGVLQKTFCRRLGISPRTFRYWKRKARAAPQATVIPLLAPEAAPKKPRRKNRGRFGLEVTLPGVQKMADTTELTFFGVRLQILALQDPGDRYRHLLDSARVEFEQSAAQVVQLIAGTPPGFQLLTDQGTPYLAQAAEQAYDQRELQHATQKEAAPTEKATLERAFRTLKDALAPMIDLSNRLAGRIPQLAQADLARPLVQMLVHCLLQVYHHSRDRLAHPCAGVDVEELEDLIEDQRARAQAQWRSKRLLLEHIHQSYQMEGSREKFVRAHRIHALQDIQEAERRLRQRACRCQVRACDRYFAGILNNVAEEGRAQRAGERRQRKKVRERDREFREIEQLRAQLHADPSRWLHQGLDLLLGNWMEKEKQLLFGGKGPGLADAGRSVAALMGQLPHTWKDQIAIVWNGWVATHAKSGQEALAAVRAVLDTVIVAAEKNSAQPSAAASAILNSAVREIPNSHPPPPPLRL